MTTCYKVCAYSNDKCVSLFKFFVGKWWLEYELEKVTEPKIGKIFVCSDLETAQELAAYRDIIFKCECDWLQPITQTPSSVNEYEAFWNGESISRWSSPIVTSYVTNWVKPIEVEQDRYGVTRRKHGIK